MSKTSRPAFSADLTEPTAITYVNGIIARNPRAWAWMHTHLPRIYFMARKEDGCLQMRASLMGPASMLLLSYWRDEDALRRFYTHPKHVELMRRVFRHPNWFTLFNETYRIPITTRYWNAPNGYALSQPWKPWTIQEAHERIGFHSPLADELGLHAGSEAAP